MPNDLTIDEIIYETAGATQEVWDMATEEWLPPNNTYDVCITAIRIVPYTNKQTTKKYSNVVITHQILGGSPGDNSLNGREWSFTFFGSNSVSMSAIKTLIGLLMHGEKPSGDVAVALKWLEKYGVGANVRCSKSQSPGREGKGPMDNVKYLSLL